MAPLGLKKKELVALVNERRADILAHNNRVLERVRRQNEDIRQSSSSDVLQCPDCNMDVHRGSLNYHRDKMCRYSRI